MSKLQELSISISETENNVEITMSKENFDKTNSDLERKEKLEKVWEIVKTKRVDIADVVTLSLEEYNERNLKVWHLTETEFNLLKEMM